MFEITLTGPPGAWGAPTPPGINGFGMLPGINGAPGFEIPGIWRTPGAFWTFNIKKIKIG